MRVIILQNNWHDKEMLYRYLVDVDRDFIPFLSEKTDLRQYVEKVIEKASLYSILSDDDNIAGLVVFYANDFEKRYAYIPLVSVRSECRRQGIAGRLLNSALDYIRSLNGKISTVGIHTNNQHAFDLYVKLGFKHISTIGERAYLEYIIK